jgi:CBS domain-containing protein
LQIPPDDFISSYNWAQAIAAPVMAISCNSPLLMGRELWRESRIALFQQSIDTRATSYALHEKESRVSFGQKWARGTVVDLFKEDITRHKVMLAKEIKSNSLEQLEKGVTPELEALKVHNSTIYHWNRACYGVGHGKPHLRIENRYLPAGPSLIDEMANMAFWVGLMIGRPKEFDDMPKVMDFKDAKSNFWKAARYGKESVLIWNNQQLNITDLLTNHLLSIAYSGLKKLKITESDINRYLDVIKNRVLGLTGAQWQIANFRKLRNDSKLDDSLRTLTKAIYENQQENLPVHKWPEIRDRLRKNNHAVKVGNIMSTKLFMVENTDLADLATNIMRWNNIHHLLIEDRNGELAGLLTWTHMKNRLHKKRNDKEIVSDIMVKNPLTIESDTSIREAIKIMKNNGYGCLPVVDQDKLVGIITLTDIEPFIHDKNF